MQDQTSLLNNLYKVKYFPCNQFYEAQLGCNPSFAWSGVIEAKNGSQKDVDGE